MSNLETILSLFHKADSISLDDEFIRFFDNAADDEESVEIILGDTRYEFSKDHLDGAIYDTQLNTWVVFDSYGKRYVDITFYSVQPLVPHKGDRNA